MKRFLLWIISVALGVALLLAAVMGVSYAFTTQGGCPDAAAQFGGQELETNGFCWQVPLPSCARICAARILKTGERSCARISHSILRGAGGNSA